MTHLAAPTTAPADIRHSSQSVEWYTPPEIVKLARRVLGAIDLDPASCAEANTTIQAARYYTQADDGLSQPWYGRVWLNPPYGKRRNKSIAGQWAMRLIAEYAAGRVSAAILLVRSTTGDLWFAPLWNYPICFPTGRQRFSGKAGNTHGSALIYFGADPRCFVEVFGTLGPVVVDQRRGQAVEVQPCLW